ncbi:hypothetical protein HA402_006035 [Bradysia odoriphaga]|nr:hypothetical protein HA402_006035 [Bradysia odoriphaga]
MLGGQHLVFEKWMKDYKSPVIGLKLGGEYCVVALTYPMVRAIHTGDEYDGRPDNFFLRLRTMGTRLGITCTDGPLWTEQRSFVTKHLREAGYGRRPMEIQIQNELNELLDVIDMTKEQPIWPGTFLAPSVINVLWTFTAGERIPRHDERLNRLLNLLNLRSKAFDMSGGILNQMAWLRHIAPEKTGYNLIKRFNHELHEFFMASINTHKADYDESKATDDLIYAYIKAMQDDKARSLYFTDVQLTMIILDIFIAGSQTTAITLDLALRTMALYPKIQSRIQAELDAVYEEGQAPSVLEKSKFSYIEATIMEVQRFFHITPITGPRRVLRETTLGGYKIPKNTTVLIHLRSVHMDKDHWGDPEVFRPERFLNEKMEIVNTEWLMPFGQGRRRCLGEQLARGCLFTFFAGILQRFEVRVCGDEKIDETLLPGITLSPKPYQVVFSKRVRACEKINST